MKVVVCVNPTTGAAVNGTDAAIRTGNSKISSLRQSDAHAVEQALRVAEQMAGHPDPEPVEIVVVTLGPTESLGALREALALGAHRAVLLDDANLRHLDLGPLAVALAALLASEPADLYLMCSSSEDIDGLLLWNAAGERLGLPAMTQAATFAMTRSDSAVVTTRQSERGDQTITAPMPCLVELSASINQARYPTLKGRSAAQNKRVDLVKPETLGIDVDQLSAQTVVVATRAAHHSRSPEVVTDASSAPERIVAFLDERRLL